MTHSNEVENAELIASPGLNKDLVKKVSIIPRKNWNQSTMFAANIYDPNHDFCHDCSLTHLQFDADQEPENGRIIDRTTAMNPQNLVVFKRQGTRDIINGLNDPSGVADRLLRASPGGG